MQIKIFMYEIILKIYIICYIIVIPYKDISNKIYLKIILSYYWKLNFLNLIFIFYFR